MDKFDAARIFNNPTDKFNLDMTAIRTLMMDLIERVEKLEEKPKSKGKKQ
jgi:hypothetical protein